MLGISIPWNLRGFLLWNISTALCVETRLHVIRNCFDFIQLLWDAVSCCLSQGASFGIIRDLKSTEYIALICVDDQYKIYKYI